MNGAVDFRRCHSLFDQQQRPHGGITPPTTDFTVCQRAQQIRTGVPWHKDVGSLAATQIASIETQPHP